MTTFTVAEHALALQLLVEYRMNLLRTLAGSPPKADLTAQGREQYAADAKVAAGAIQKLLDDEPRADS